ncbi:tyrosine-type recombinase/integrase [Vibrio alginolyticus]|uniref:tyrosine-type recombinase/integrase n=1 Tax=Vibrio alginolyticus TaxID=663 RepID=UPI002160A782|nr:tyrosine-type recombinase/integrase [Vibrio alginolyticus]MCS0110207.1 tyrosine-type recombinase/integrase [Vibrio alginolyticus]
MTKTSHSIYSINNLEQEPQQGSSLFTVEQVEWIDAIELPQKLFLMNATEFDDQFLTLTSDWRYRFSGANKAILFATGRNFRGLSSSSIKLMKHLTVEYIKENSASGANWFAEGLATIFRELEAVSRESMIAKLRELVNKVDRNQSDNSNFYFTLYALRRLDRSNFFKSTGDKGDLEDLLLEVPRPRNAYWGRYQNLDLVIPDEVCLMIENGVQLWASKLCPKLETKESKIKHFEKLKKTVKVDVLRDCIIVGIIYYTGARPVQFGKMAGGDYVVDTMNQHGMRYSFLVPYAKQPKLTLHRVRVAIPEELGKLITLYKHLEKIGDEDQLFPTKSASSAMVNKSIKNMLLKFSPKEIQEAVKTKGYKLPIYPATLFRHNVGHSMAMNGASAAEIAYILGHTNYTVADKYIAATPEMADIREQALGRNPVFKNMMVLMLTGNLIHSSKWEGRRVAASIGGKLYHHVGGCKYEENICPFSQGRACYGCLYFMPFTDGNHKEALNSFFDEIDEIRNIADDTGQVHHPVMTELVRRKDHVLQVIARIEMVQAKEGNE